MVQTDISQFARECNDWRETLRSHRDELHQMQTTLQKAVNHPLSREEQTELEHLQKFLTDKGYNVIVLVRDEIKNHASNNNITYAKWDVEKGELDKAAIASADYIIHLAGANVAAKRWTKKRKKEIVESRTKSANLLIRAMKETPNNIKAVVSASAIGWYGPDTDASKQFGFKEDAASLDDFLGKTCKLWEESIQPVEALNKRLVITRFGNS